MTDRLRSALAEALHQQEHDPVEDARGDPPDIICDGDLEIADAILADPAVRAALADSLDAAWAEAEAALPEMSSRSLAASDPAPRPTRHMAGSRWLSGTLRILGRSRHSRRSPPRPRSPAARGGVVSDDTGAWLGCLIVLLALLAGLLLGYALAVCGGVG